MVVGDKFYFYEIYGTLKHMNLVGDYIGLQLQTMMITKKNPDKIPLEICRRINSSKSSQIIDERFNGEYPEDKSWEHDAPLYIEARYRNFHKIKRGEGLITVGEEVIAGLHPGNRINLLMKARLQKLLAASRYPNLASSYEAEFQIIDASNNERYREMEELLLWADQFSPYKNH